MTERPEGAPDASPTEPEAAPEAETETGAPEPAAATSEELGGVTGALDAETDYAEADELEDELEADEAAAGDLDEEIEGETTAPLGAEPTAVGTPATGAAVARRRGATPPSVQRAPTQSELAVRVTDNASRFFVIGTVVIFAAILLFGLLAGNGGLLTTTPAPTPAPSVSIEPSASASAGASESVAPSASASQAP